MLSPAVSPKVVLSKSPIYGGDRKNRSNETNEKLSVTIFSSAKIFVTITLKNRCFLCLKVSGANGDLDIFVDKNQK